MGRTGFVETAAWYRRFAEIEARGSSPQYERLALAVAGDPGLTERIGALPRLKQQPNLVFSAVRLLGGPTADVEEFRSFVLDRWGDVSEVVLARRTQTNEPARCAALVAGLAELVEPQTPVALIEVGASAGLCLLPDRYGYDFGRVEIGESTLRLAVDCFGPVPVPDRVPAVVSRIGLDLDPVDITDPDDVEWLRACVWPEHAARRERLDLALELAANDPPPVVAGDLVTDTVELIEAAPADATTVVFHSATLAYVTPDDRRRFCDALAAVAEHDDNVIWLSNEAPGVISEVTTVDEPPPVAKMRAHFVLARGGREPLALTDPHGSWIRWLD